MSYSDFLHQEFGDAEGKDNRWMKDIRDERKVGAGGILGCSLCAQTVMLPAVGRTGLS